MDVWIYSLITFLVSHTPKVKIENTYFPVDCTHGSGRDFSHLFYSTWEAHFDPLDRRWTISAARIPSCFKWPWTTCCSESKALLSWYLSRNTVSVYWAPSRFFFRKDKPQVQFPKWLWICNIRLTATTARSRWKLFSSHAYKWQFFDVCSTVRREDYHPCRTHHKREVLLRCPFGKQRYKNSMPFLRPHYGRWSRRFRVYWISKNLWKRSGKMWLLHQQSV